MANAERHAELDPTGHWLQEEGAVCRYFEELLTSSAAPDRRRTYGRDHLRQTLRPDARVGERLLGIRSL